MAAIAMAERVAVPAGAEGWFTRMPKEFRKGILARGESKVCKAGEPVYRTARS